MIADVLVGGPGSGKEVLVPVNWEIAVLDAAGTQLTSSRRAEASPFSRAGPLTGLAVDVNGATVEIVATTGDASTTLVAAWKGTGSTTQVPWGMFHRDAAANGRAPNAGTCMPRSTVATRFFPLTPCRVIDTRVGNGQLGGPALAAQARRNFPIAGVCGVPAAAVAISANLTVTDNGGSGDLVVFPADVSAAEQQRHQLHCLQDAGEQRPRVPLGHDDNVLCFQRFPDFGRLHPGRERILPVRSFHYPRTRLG